MSNVELMYLRFDGIPRWSVSHIGRESIPEAAWATTYLSVAACVARASVRSISEALLNSLRASDATESITIRRTPLAMMVSSSERRLRSQSVGGSEGGRWVGRRVGGRVRRAAARQRARTTYQRKRSAEVSAKTT